MFKKYNPGIQRRRVDFPIEPVCSVDWLFQAFDPSEFARRTLNFTPDATQQRVLREMPRRLLLNCNRQWGKSTISAIMLAHRAAFVPESLSIMASPSERQSAETLRKVETFLQLAGVRTGSDKVNRRSIRLQANGSRIVALPSSDAKIRGFSKVSLIVIDEASRVPDPLYYALRPSLSTCNGDLMLVSTPFGKRGFFHREFTEGGPEWTRLTVPVSQCSRISQKFINEERQVGEEYFAQEYNCEFIEDGRYLLTDTDCRRLFKSDVKPLEGFDRRSETWKDVMKQPIRPSNYNPDEEE